MGKKAEKGKNRISGKKEELIRIQKAKHAVMMACELENPLNDFPAFRIFKKNGVNAYLEFYNVNDINEETFNEIFQLEKENMETIYDSCSWGWNEGKKYEEMKENGAKYIIARDEVTDKIIAFTHFRFDVDYGDEVLYCYELQLSPRVRRKGFGKFLLQVLESIAFKNNMKKVVLTVLKHNLPAVNFFHSLKYEPDETNPEENIFESVPYRILSKKQISV